jgi:hypothetical protein
MESNIPPMLAAQSAFPSGPLPIFHKITPSTNLEMLQNRRKRNRILPGKEDKMIQFCLSRQDDNALF